MLQPLVMGRAVSIHPLAVVLAIAAGGVLAGIVGALLAVPTVAFLNSAVRVLLAEDPAAEEAAQEADDGPSSRPKPTTSRTQTLERSSLVTQWRDLRQFVAMALHATRTGCCHAADDIAVGVSRRHSYIDPAEFRHIVVSPDVLRNTVGLVR